MFFLQMFISCCLSSVLQSACKKKCLMNRSIFSCISSFAQETLVFFSLKYGIEKLSSRFDDFEHVYRTSPRPPPDIQLNEWVVVRLEAGTQIGTTFKKVNYSDFFGIIFTGQIFHILRSRNPPIPSWYTVRCFTCIKSYFHLLTRSY